MKMQETTRRIEPQYTPEATKRTANLKAAGGRAPAKIAEPPHKKNENPTTPDFVDTGGTHLTALDDW